MPFGGDPEETRKMKPNILFLFPDQHRWDWLPATGPVEMKNLRSLMDRGTTFTQAITNSLGN